MLFWKATTNTTAWNWRDLKNKKIIMFNDIAHFERNSTEAYTDNIGGVTFIGTFV
jgi:hypothetical protein